MTDAIARLTSALSDRYVIGWEVGRGGMAVVYLADDVKHERQVAAQILVHGGDEEYVRQKVQVPTPQG